MRIKAVMKTKETEIHPESFTISDIKELSKDEYLSFYSNPLKSTNLLDGLKEENVSDGEHRPSILLLGEDYEDGILVDSQGKDYAYRTSFIPKARTLVNEHIKTLVEYAVSEGTEHSISGRWETSYEELYNHFGANLTPQNGNCKLFVEALQKRKEVESLTVTEDGIDVKYNPEFCKNLYAGDYDDEDLDYKEAVKAIVEKEYGLFEREMTEGKTPMDVLANNYQIYVKTEIMRTICEDENFDDKVYKALYQDRGEILKNLYDDFIDNPQESLNSEKERKHFIEQYCNEFHSDVMLEDVDEGMSMGGLK